MFEWIRTLFQKEEVQPTSQKPIIITIHGYGRRCQHEFDNFALWGKQDGFEIIQFDMYDLFDEEDHDWIKWVARAKKTIDSYILSGRDMYVVGFSMGGVIASYLASIYPIKKLILLAPAFQYINMDLVTGAITKSAASLWSNEKKEEIQLPRSFYSAFMDIIKNLRKYISQVQCPVLFVHGDQDEVISIKSSINAYEKVPHNKKKLFLLHEGHHRLLMDEKVNWECYQLMKLFLDDVILHDRTIEMAPDIMDTLIQRKQELDAQKKTTTQEEAQSTVINQ